MLEYAFEEVECCISGYSLFGGVGLESAGHREVICRRAAEDSTGTVRFFLTELACALERQTEPDVQSCVREIMVTLPPAKLLNRQLRELGATLGRFDLPGQLRGLESAIRSTEEALRSHREGAEGRRRSCQTLGLCAGAAMAILFL